MLLNMINKRVAIFLPDGVGIRNYLFSDLIKKLKQNNAEVIIYHKIGDAALLETQRIHGVEMESYSLPNYKESALEKFYRELDCLVRLKFFGRKLNNPTIVTNWRPPKRTRMLKVFYSGVEFFSRFFKSYNAILKIEKLYRRRAQQSAFLNGYVSLLQNTKPDIILCTHQRSILATPLFEAARQLGIKTVTAIYSWDNLPKARMAFRADKYFVWSDYMRDEIGIYYPEISQDKVVVTGTPQFEFYRKQEYLLTRTDFCQKYGFDANRPIICYSGGDTLTSPYDQVYLKDLAQALQDIPMERRPQILFRRCPVDWSPRFDKVLTDFSDVIISVDPLWTYEKNDIENWTLTYPKFEDVVLLVNVAYHCDMVYNVGSTMAHDYSMFDKPACYINYNPDGADKLYSIDEIYQYQHFRSMPSPEAVIWIMSKNDIAGKVMHSIENGGNHSLQRKAWVEKVILHPVEKASDNITKALLEAV